MEIYIESMTKVIVPWAGLVIRCWRQEDMIDDKTNKKNQEELRLFVLNKDNSDLFSIGGNSCYPIAEAVLKLERMNAVEVLDGAGNGVVLYRDWP